MTTTCRISSRVGVPATHSPRRDPAVRIARRPGGAAPADAVVGGLPNPGATRARPPPRRRASSDASASDARRGRRHDVPRHLPGRPAHAAREVAQQALGSVVVRQLVVSGAPPRGEWCLRRRVKSSIAPVIFATLYAPVTPFLAQIIPRQISSPPSLARISHVLMPASHRDVRPTLLHKDTNSELALVEPPLLLLAVSPADSTITRPSSTRRRPRAQSASGRSRR